MNQVTIYTDGSCVNATHDRGGYGIVLIRGKEIKQYCGGSYFNTSSARQELRGMVSSLKYVNKGEHANVFMDCEWIVNSVEKEWVFRWHRNNFKGRAHADLWTIFVNEYFRLDEKVKLNWIRGHAEIKEHNYYNHVADILANKGAHKTTKIKDS